MDQENYSLDEIREGIDRVDQQIRTLFLERMELARQVARVKARTEDRIYKPDREALILEKQTEGIDEQILMEYRALLRRMMEISRKYQYGLTMKMRSCFPFSFEQGEIPFRTLAMLREELFICDFCSRDLVRTGCSFEEIGSWIRSGETDAGAGIIEKIGRGVSDPLNTMLMRFDLYISQCRVITVGEDKYKVVLFTPKLTVRADHNRLKIVFVIPNRSGALGSIFSMISDYGVNLTEVHSIPYRSGQEWNYRFFAELEINLLREDAQALLYQLSQETADLRLLGSYHCEGDF